MVVHEGWWVLWGHNGWVSGKASGRERGTYEGWWSEWLVAHVGSLGCDVAVRGVGWCSGSSVALWLSGEVGWVVGSGRSGCGWRSQVCPRFAALETG